MTRPDPSVLDLADNIINTLTDPAALALTVGSSRPRSQSLANGSAGVALLHIERACAQPEHWATAHAWLSDATSIELTCGLAASVYFGVPALAFVTHLAAEGSGRYQRAHTQLDSATTALTRARLAAAYARIDRGERPALAEFDLIRGLTGLGAYHLQCSPHHDITAAVLTYLVQLTEPAADGSPGWWTDHGPTGQPPATYPGGHGNFGMAHGIAGPLALLALALRRGVVVDRHIDAITRICSWLDTWQRSHPAGTWWPRTITRGETRTGRTRQHTPLQPSWCYGTPGIARAQQLAALATGDTARRHTAESALLGCVRDPAQLVRIVDLSLCHGAAGLLHITRRAADDAATGELATSLPDLTEMLLHQLRVAPHDPGLLEGTTGAALALLAAATQAPPRSCWDACLLLA